MKHILRNYYGQVSHIIYIMMGNFQFYQFRLISLTLVGLFLLLFEAIVLFGIFATLILSLFLGCAITDSCYAVQNVATTSSEWGSNQ